MKDGQHPNGFVPKRRHRQSEFAGKEFFTEREAADYIGVSQTQLNRRGKDLGLEYRMIFGRRIYWRKQIDLAVTALFTSSQDESKPTAREALAHLYHSSMETRAWIARLTDWAGVGDPPIDDFDAAIELAKRALSCGGE